MAKIKPYIGGATPEQIDQEFEAFWQAYPKAGKANASKKRGRKELPQGPETGQQRHHVRGLGGHGPAVAEQGGRLDPKPSASGDMVEPGAMGSGIPDPGAAPSQDPGQRAEEGPGAGEPK